MRGFHGLRVPDLDKGPCPCCEAQAAVEAKRLAHPAGLCPGCGDPIGEDRTKCEACRYAVHDEQEEP